MKIETGKHKVLLMVLPFLTPVCPPVGISCLKGFLQKHGYNVRTADAMSDIEVREVCYRYFDTLKAFIPEKKRGHFFNIGLDVWSNHFMAHLNYQDESKYVELIKSIVYKNYYVTIDNTQVYKLKDIAAEFYSKLERFVLDLVEKEKPTVVGASTYRGTLPSTYFALKIIKEKYPSITTIMGGTIFSQELFLDTPNFNTFMEKAAFIDKIFVGEGENLFLKFLRGEIAADKKVITLDEINNELLNLDTLNIPDYSDFSMGDYPLLPSYTSRGCVYRCSFCAETVYWKKYRKKNAAKVADEFVEMSNKYGSKLFLLTDCLINPLVEELADEITERDLNLYWDVYLKVDQRVCDPKHTLKWRKGGFYRARLGIESGSQKILDIIDKKITVDDIRKSLISLANAGIKTTTYWIAGHPGETEEDFQETLDLLEELQDYIFEAEADPFRYFYNGQVNADQWSNNVGNSLLYPEDTDNTLLIQSWTLNADPSREVVYDRACRFREKCIELGIPNPYSASEIYHADKRWQRLHKNAVPPLMELNNIDDFADESKRVADLLMAEANIDDTDFNF